MRRLPDGEEYFAIRQYWTLPKYIQQTEFYRLIVYEPLPRAFHDMDRAMFWICKEASKDLEYNLRILHSVKIWLKVNAQYESANPEAPSYKSFETELGRSSTTVGEYPLSEITLIDQYKPYQEALRVLADRLYSRHANVIRKESGFVLLQIINCQLKILKFHPIGSAYQPLPKRVASKKAIINVHNYDERCFGYAVISALKENVSEHHRSEAKSYTEEDFIEYGLDLIHYPVPVQSIPEIEERLDISFRVASFYDDEGRSLYPLYNTKRVRARHINLLYYNGHYAWIKNIHRMLGFISKDGHKLFFCENCWGVKSHSESVIARHVQLCSREDWCSVIHTLPSPGYMLEFKNFKYQTPAPFTIYIDCESLTEPIDEHRGNTTFYQRHKCCSATALLVSNVPMFNNHWFS